MTEHLCVCCPHLRRGEPRTYDRAQVDEGCRARLRSLLAETVDHYTHLTLHRGSTGGDKISGSRTPPLPLVVDALDLTLAPHTTGVADDLVPLYSTVQLDVPVWLPARPTHRDEYPMTMARVAQRVRQRDHRGILAYGNSGDQVGEISVPGLLDSWARDWQSREWATLPTPTVVDLAWWLGERLDWACDHHPAIADFAQELDELVHTIRPAAPPIERKVGIPCRDCDMVTLYRWAGSDYVECFNCPVLMTPEEYSRWTQMLVMPEHLPWAKQVIEAQKPQEAA